MVAVPSWAGTGSAVASFLFVWAMVRNHIPKELYFFISTTLRKAFSFLNPYIHIKLDEYSSERMRKDELYSAAEAYLSSACLHRARRLKAELRRKTDRPFVTIDEYEEVTDTFCGVTVWWHASKHLPKSTTTVISFNSSPEERRFYRLSFHKRHRNLIENDYLDHILTKGRASIARNRQRRLFTNNPTGGGSRNMLWSHVAFEHPATFDTLAMDPERKKAIIDDLVTFREGKEYYKHVGKAWKRGYLLFGPPGTGKSTMIAAIANFLEYDVYDLELTAVKNNTELRKIFLETTGKSIIVIEDIDCSLDLTGERKDKKKKHKDETEAPPSKAIEEVDIANKVTLSGLLNFIDGLWSACGGEKIIIFTTNHIEKLDPALIRRGRMDMHIEMSYCTFEAFKVLAKNYLGIENHHLFDSIRELLLEMKVSPADAAEGLMLKNSGNKDVDVYLQNFIENLNKSKEEANKNAEDMVAVG
ncbi:mitochondrial chaperone BCS1-B [Carex littledalei]|uniref:Mitochondrial chaperone BCS1-B n=1 Tax=Carex littledalei TaxID=544730 RepID=A0A833V7A9_9POAL|nr:mitochondrial chaperone BCS1-B [Carex littledalei]